MEEFRDIKGYEGSYQISSLGRVKSLKYNKERFLAIANDSYGYEIVTLSKEGKHKTFTIHRLLAVAFLGHIPCGYTVVVDHIDNNFKNNSLDNLQLITHRENLSKDKKGGSSKYSGVWFDKRSKKWESKISINGKQKYLGRFNCETAAYLAYQSVLSYS